VGNNTKNLEDTKFGRLTVLYKSHQDKYNRWYYLCRCDCGTEKTIASRHLISGNTISCGCVFKETSPINGKKGAIKHSGILSHLYKPELSDQHRIETRNLEQLRLWRQSVFTRDNYTCQVCGSRGKLNAHHLNSWSLDLDNRFNLENGITLCKKCHFDFHMSLGGYRIPATKEDFKRWYLEREIAKL